jgi:hypothetical protein
VSAASNEIRPDEKPSPPEAPTVKAGDKNMVINWPSAKTEGSAVKHYNLEISPPPSSGIAVKNEVAGLTYTWPGLTNGIKYRVRAQAVNELGPSEWGIYSVEDNPAGVPGAPAAPTTAVASAVGSENQIRVDWAEPDTNGDPIRNYYVTMSGGGAAPQTQTVAGTTRTAVFRAQNSETGYTFTVQADNKAGRGAVGPASAPRRATGKLGQVSGVTAAPANTDGAGRQVTVTFQELTDAERNGSSREEVTYSYNATNGSSGPIRPGQTLGGFENGTEVGITVVARSTAAPSSNASAPGKATPYGSPGSPSASGQDGGINQKSVTLNWSSPSTSTNDVAQTRINIGGRGWESAAPSGSRTVNTSGYEETVTLEVQTFNSLGTGGPVARASARSGQVGQWEVRIKTSDPKFERTCTFTEGGSNYRPFPYTDCDGVSGDVPPWFYKVTQDRIVVKCYIEQSDNWSGTGILRWWRVEPGSSRNVGRFVIAGHTTLPDPVAWGAPRC